MLDTYYTLDLVRECIIIYIIVKFVAKEKNITMKNADAYRLNTMIPINIVGSAKRLHFSGVVQMLF